MCHIPDCKFNFPGDHGISIGVLTADLGKFAGLEVIDPLDRQVKSKF
jgi:hypothetical protein